MRITGFLLVACLTSLQALAQENKTIHISTDETDLVLRVENDGRLYQTYLGERLTDEQETKELWAPGSGEAYPGAGGGTLFEPALAITHADGNRSTILRYVSSEQQTSEHCTKTTIRLKDDQYPVEVNLHYVAYPKENVIKMWSDIRHQEKKPVTLWLYASAMLYFSEPEYHLVEFSGDWAGEAQLSSQPLHYGKKVIDTQLGTNAGRHVSPLFELGLNGPVKEHSGRVLLGSIGWTGNFRFTFEVDNENKLRILPSINPYASDYELKPGQVFATPEFVFTLSDQGTGKASRNLHDWARRYQLKDGMGDRLSLLNNWENTYFDFNEQRLGELMQEGRKLGVDMFLLDDGWFGNKYPRNEANAGLGDWEAMRSKLPGGIPALMDKAAKNGIKFGLWIEPEMVNPKSELFEKHPEWAVRYPNRETYYFRNQLVLDMANPEVQDFSFGVVDRILTENPELKFFKWDCNSALSNAYSPYLKEKQGNLYIDHVRGLYNVMQRVNVKYPNVELMLCSGGGARCDYEALKYFGEFWCSDNTDPVSRLYIQWGFSQFFPVKSMCAHVTDWNRSTSIKFRTDVASMCKLGFDLGLQHLSADELAYCQQAVANWKRLKPVILDGDLYRLYSPYEGEHMAVMYNDGKALDKAVLFTYDIHPRLTDKTGILKLQGLDASKRYRVQEINLIPGQKSGLSANGKIFTGDYLMKVGLDVFTGRDTYSRVIELTAE